MTAPHRSSAQRVADELADALKTHGMDTREALSDALFRLDLTVVPCAVVEAVAAGRVPQAPGITAPADHPHMHRLAIYLAHHLGDAEAVVTKVLAEAMVGLQLAVVTTLVADDHPEYTPPTVTVASLFERAATAVDRGQFPAAVTLLGVVAETADCPLLSAYRALVDVLTDLGRAGVGSAAAAEVEAELRTRVYDLLVRGPDAAQPTGQEEF